ncbi:MAG: hypothetical protein HY874_03590 [Chloroflexi bacterium]|nr:hypothetical protein [Chloroflexota bacterium]
MERRKSRGKSLPEQAQDDGAAPKTQPELAADRAQTRRKATKAEQERLPKMSLTFKHVLDLLKNLTDPIYLGRTPEAQRLVITDALEDADMADSEENRGIVLGNLITNLITTNANAVTLNPDKPDPAITKMQLPWIVLQLLYCMMRTQKALHLEAGISIRDIPRQREFGIKQLQSALYIALRPA